MRGKEERPGTEKPIASLPSAIPTRRDEVQRKCGEPDAKHNEGYRWVYKEPQWVYVLQFNHEGKLIMIQRTHPDEDSD